VIVVSNTSPITSLAAIGYLNLLHDIYVTIIIPVAVYEEMTGLGYSVPGTIEVQTLSWIEKRDKRSFIIERFTEGITPRRIRNDSFSYFSKC
jgi:predicted nucleic acid-binding protein